MSTELDNALSLLKEIASDRNHPDFHKIGNGIISISQRLSHQLGQKVQDKDRYKILSVRSEVIELFDDVDDELHVYTLELTNKHQQRVQRRVGSYKKLNPKKMVGKTIMIHGYDHFHIE